MIASLTPKMERGERRKIAIRATLIAGLIPGVFTDLGQLMLREPGVTLPALQTVGGIVLALIVLDMILVRLGSGFKLTPPDGQEAQTKDDLAVSPLATPFPASPGAMSAGFLLAAKTKGDPIRLCAFSCACSASCCRRSPFRRSPSVWVRAV